MNREITFRGKRLRDNQFVYGSLIVHGDKYFIVVDFELDQYEQVEPTTVGQFTGLVDKNGKEIYEGATVEIKNSSRFTKGFVGFPDGYKGKCTSEVKIIEGHPYVWLNPTIKGSIVRFGAQLLFEGQSKHIDMRGVATSAVELIEEDK